MSRLLFCGVKKPPMILLPYFCTIFVKHKVNSNQIIQYLSLNEKNSNPSKPSLTQGFRKQR